VIEIAGEERGNARRQLEHLGMPHLEGGRIIHLRGLFLDRGHDLRMAVPGIAAPETGGAVEHASPIGGEVVHALGADEKTRLRLELSVGGKRHPEGFEIVGNARLHFRRQRFRRNGHAHLLAFALRHLRACLINWSSLAYAWLYSETA